MEILEWTDEYLTGTRELDSQHKQLIYLLNKAHRDLSADSGTGDADLILVELMDYATFHLKYEVKWLDKAGLTASDKHQRVIEHLRKKVLKIQNYYFRSDKASSQKILSFMNRWILNHLADAKASLGGTQAHASLP
jgi:hemerythrin